MFPSRLTRVVGAYFFGSVDEHRYQLQRHARKLQARVFARKARRSCVGREMLMTFWIQRGTDWLLSFPFRVVGCTLTHTSRWRLIGSQQIAIYDVLACYLYLISQQPPETVIMAGDSAGGGMVLSILVILRDQGIPMPAGAVLISPWVDLCHSFPSIAAGEFETIPRLRYSRVILNEYPPPCLY
jgi:hypothetical protein